MKTEVLAKIYMTVFGLINIGYFISLYGIMGSHVLFEGCFYDLWRPAFLLALYGLLPLIAASRENEYLCLAVAAASAVSVSASFFGSPIYIGVFNYVFTSLNVFTVILAVVLAADKVSEKVAGEILSLKWSQS